MSTRMLVPARRRTALAATLAAALAATLAATLAAIGLAAIGLAITACSGPPEGPTADAGPPLLTLGTGAEAFTPLAEGGTIFAYMGPQGGFHVFLSLRAANVAPGDRDELPTTCDAAGTHVNPCVDFVVVDATTGDLLDLYVPLRLSLAPLATGGYELPMSRVVQLDIGSLADVVGKTVLVSASLVDTVGRSATASVAVTVVSAGGAATAR